MATSITERIGAVEVDRSRHWTLADLDALPDDPRRREIICGVLYVTPVARRYHQRVVFRFSYRLGRWEEEHGGQVYPGVEVNLPEGSHLEPDVAVFIHGRGEPERYGRGERFTSPLLPGLLLDLDELLAP